MKLGVFLALFENEPLEKALQYVSGRGLEAVEIYVGGNHCNREELLGDEEKLRQFQKLFAKYNLSISGLSCHSNPVHPDGARAQKNKEIHRQTILLAEKLGIDKIITFSGCPGDHEGAKHPNWVTCAWPGEYLEVLKWQWEEKVIPFWQKEAGFASEHGVKVAIEMHPGFCVYNPETLLRLRNSCGDAIGANLDPSHLFWQGIDPIKAVRKLGDAIYYVHAKDTQIYEINSQINGVLDTKTYDDEANRSWIFRTVGYGHGEKFWRDFVSTLRIAGYDNVLSIEHEDSLMSRDEGFQKAVNFLKSIVLTEGKPQMWWA